MNINKIAEIIGPAAAGPVPPALQMTAGVSLNRWYIIAQLQLPRQLAKAYFQLCDVHVE